MSEVIDLHKDVLQALLCAGVRANKCTNATAHARFIVSHPTYNISTLCTYTHTYTYMHTHMYLFLNTHRHIHTQI